MDSQDLTAVEFGVKVWNRPRVYSCRGSALNAKGHRTFGHD